MKAVYLEDGAVNRGDLSLKPIAELCELTVYKNTTEDDKFEHIGDAEAVFSNKIVFDEDTFAKLPNLKYLGVCATGYNVIDIEAAKRHGVTVTNVPAYSTESVAQLAWGFILESACHIREHDESVKRGDWVKSDTFCYWTSPVMELAGKTIGIVGFGNIGRRVAEVALAFRMNVLVHTAHPEKYADYLSSLGYGSLNGTSDGATPDRGSISFVGIDELFKMSDIISLHCPMNRDTENLIRKENIDKMKDGVIIVNVSRGGLVAEQDLEDALKSGKVGAAAVDVVRTEPMISGNPLLAAPNICITPHMAWASMEARTRLIDVVAENFAAFLKNEKKNVLT